MMVAMIGKCVVSIGVILSLGLFALGGIGSNVAATQIVLASESPPAVPISVNWEQFTALMILAFVVVTFVLRTLPHYAEQMTNQTKVAVEATKVFAETIQTVTAKYAESMDKNTDVIRMLTARCAESQAVHSRVLSELQSKIE